MLQTLRRQYNVVFSLDFFLETCVHYLERNLEEKYRFRVIIFPVRNTVEPLIKDRLVGDRLVRDHLF